MAWGLGLVAIIILYFYYQNWIEKKKYEKPVYLKNLEEAKSFLRQIENQNDYITWVERDEILSNYNIIGKFFKGKTNYYKKEKVVEHFNEIYQNFHGFVKKYNRNFVEAEKVRLVDYFDNIEGKSLDNQQRNAVLTDEYSNLIVAGAGSGKTLTILGKVKYLLEQKKMDPKHILILSFTQKTVEELNERLQKGHPYVKALTFHKLGYDIIKKHLSKPPAVTNENTLGNVINQYLLEDIFEEVEALNAFVQYVACYMNIPEEFEKYDSLGEKIDIEKGTDFETLKAKSEPLNMQSNASLNTMQGERVKSVEELTIANFLYLNGINYEYEKRYPIDEFVYQPDFYLTDYNIYLEHFGVDEHNRAKWLEPLKETEYVEGMKKKRQIHLENETKLLESYSYFNRDNILIEKLEEMLEQEGVEFAPRDTKNILSRITGNNKNFGSEIHKLIESFINLSKSRRLKKEGLVKLFASQKTFFNLFMRDRYQMFLEFALPILKKYDTILKDRNEIDFNDMINLATDVLNQNSPSFDYKYIIIDEYQDISFARFKLIQKIRELTGARLTCVGDDWQSIYRFAGSDISLFSNFEKHVGQHELLLIEQTYRNSQSLVDISSGFIKKNDRQISKSPISQVGDLNNPVKFCHYMEGNTISSFINQIKYLVDTYGNKSILVLGRHSFDINDLIKLSSNNQIKYIQRTGELVIQGFEDVEIKFLTIHKSKGTEADNVIVLNLRNTLLGFPNKMSDDPILSLLLSDSEQYSFAEERRLFYVALTRTKNEVILMVPSEVSLFADELIKDYDYLFISSDKHPKKTKCPYCKTGVLLIRKNEKKKNKFLGCSNYPICNQTFNDVGILHNDILCPDCKSGFMVKRKAKFSAFLGCTNYPKCKCTLELGEKRNKIGFIK